MNSTEKLPIVLIHGLWMTPASWNTWAERFRAQGHEVIIPGWPGIDDRSVADIRRDPSALKGIGLRQIADPELRACLESLAARLVTSDGVPQVAPDPIPFPPLRRIS